MPVVAHCSDLHLLSLRGANPLWLLGKRITGAANLLCNRAGQFPVKVARALALDIREQRPDHLVVSGDVTNLSLPAELDLVAEVLSEAGLPEDRITVVPGNHDCYTRGVEREELFSQKMHSFLRGHLQPGPGHFPFVRLQDGLAVVALSTARASAPLLAVGTLGPRQVRLCADLLMHPACQERFRLVVLHHPPIGKDVRWHNRLTDAEAFLAMLRRTGAELVVHGHLHRRLLVEVPGPGQPVPICGVASGTWLARHHPRRRAQYHLYHLDGKTLRGIEVRCYDPTSGRFGPPAAEVGPFEPPFRAE